MRAQLKISGSSSLCPLFIALSWLTFQMYAEWFFLINFKDKYSALMNCIIYCYHLLSTNCQTLCKVYHLIQSSQQPNHPYPHFTVEKTKDQRVKVPTTPNVV